MDKRTALVVGSTGVVGQNLAKRLLKSGWEVLGLSRGRQVVDGVKGLAADLRDGDAVRTAVSGSRVTDVFISAWVRH